MKACALAVVGVLALAGSVQSAVADRYEASVAVQPQAGTAWVSEVGAHSARVLGAGFALRATYGLRDWLAIETELGALALGQARFDGVTVSVGGSPPMIETITRTTHTGRLAVGATLRMGVAWIPTLGLGMGIQPTLRGDAQVGSGLVPDGRDGGVALHPLGFVRAGLDRRLSARWVVGVAVRAAHDGSMATVDVGISFARHWYPQW
jgi:hypothetical protein